MDCLVNVAGAVSIHAPARGATYRPRSCDLQGGVSIHAPARGATGAFVHVLRLDAVSIHAPARGATAPSLLRHETANVSIHAPARGATAVVGFPLFAGLFRSTPPRGGRLEFGGKRVGSIRFDPRPREGGDDRRIHLHRRAEVSIHAPARGATIARSKDGVTSGVSIHAPARGATGGACPTRWSQRVSIHAPARGATTTFGCRGTGGQFRSTPPRGGRRLRTSPTLSADCFDPRPREGGDI